MANSTERAEVVIDWVVANVKLANEDKAIQELLGRNFWEIIRQEWPGFDRINHEFYEQIFTKFRPYWNASPAELALTDEVEIWRGQNRQNQQLGLSWATDRSIAERFARGLRFKNSEPVLYRTKTKSTDIALAIDDRGEAEVVLFERPKHYEEVPITIDTRESQ